MPKGYLINRNNSNNKLILSSGFGSYFVELIFLLGARHLFDEMPERTFNLLDSIARLYSLIRMVSLRLWSISEN
ncbi:hypothetical protein QVD17_15733 [Tagetes erecta]|uniref:Uncharacterized protein n=1 Tax=Tagetes erecta TaxID=13708 RepID=A0AAD8NZX6_TARER|nr:hypothetical protein QVD17_15733 [Tagetes erecta]